jgi:ABC-type branched-subunit amino acid transport system substrate-binding protein
MNAPLSPPGAERTDGSSVRIGALVPLTRPGWVEAGQHLLAGLELAVGEVNDAGGIAGRPLALVVRDTAADPHRAAAAVDELAGLGVAAVAGEYHSVAARAAAARADALGLPFLCSSAVLDALTEQPTEWVARLAPAQSHGWQVYADFLLSAGHSRIAVAAEPSVYWASGTRILRDYLAPRGGTVIELGMRALAPRVERALRERLAQAPSFVAFEGYDTVAVLADVLRSHGADRARTAESWPRVAVECTAGRSSSPTRQTSASGNGPGRQSTSLTETRRNPIASGSFTPAERARRSDRPDLSELETVYLSAR